MELYFVFREHKYTQTHDIDNKIISIPPENSRPNIDTRDICCVLVKPERNTVVQLISGMLYLKHDFVVIQLHQLKRVYVIKLWRFKTPDDTKLFLLASLAITFDF